MGTLNGKRALVTGASQGIGKAIVEDLLDKRCDVVIHSFRGGKEIDKLYNLAQQTGNRLECFRGDLTIEKDVIQCVNDAISFLGGLDILINNSGALVERRFLEKIDLEYWQKVLDVNLSTMMLVTRQSVAHLEKAGNSSIVNLSSLAGRKGGHPGSLVYASTKGAVLTWTRALAVELAPKGIRVNTVAPGLILNTSFHETHSTKASIKETIASIPLGRAGMPEDVARAVTFLAGEYDGFITGETIDINGGVYCA
jgi:3-oxoacyl-[acyl-carrier protein] reductase